MKRLIRSWLDALAAELGKVEAESRSGISMIEAAEASDFEADLRAVTSSEREREDLRRATILLAQLGITAADVEPMARYWFTGKGAGRA